MKGFINLLTPLLVGLAAAGPVLHRAAPAPLRVASAGAETTGGYIVVLKDDAEPQAHVSALGLGDGVLSNFGTKRVYNGVLKGYAGNFNNAQLNSIRANPDVAYVEPDQIMHTTNRQSPAGYGLAISGEKGRTSASNLNRYYYDGNAGQGVKVYVVDTGVYGPNLDFGWRARTITSFITGSPFVPGKTTDDNGHGTHCSGTIGSKTYGIAKNTTIFGVKVLNSQGEGYNSDIISGINFAVQNCSSSSAPTKCLISMSLGGGYSQALNDAVNNAFTSGVPVFVAAGNENQDACNTSPASADYAFAVGAIDSSYARASFSNYGQCVNIFAPGVNINSTWIGSTATNILSGTSMATPHVAGIAAYYLSFENLTPTQLYQRITNNTQKGLVSGAGTGSPNAVANNGYFIKHPSAIY